MKRIILFYLLLVLLGTSAFAQVGSRVTLMSLQESPFAYGDLDENCKPTHNKDCHKFSVFKANQGDNAIYFKNDIGETIIFKTNEPLPITYVQSTVAVFAGQVGTNANTPPPYFPNTQNPSRLAYNTTYHKLWAFNGSTWQPIGGMSYTAGAGINITGNTISALDISPNNECNTNISVNGGNLNIVDACGTNAVATNLIAPIQGADNGLTKEGDTLHLGGILHKYTDINANSNIFSITDTSLGTALCVVKRQFGFNLPDPSGITADDIVISYEVKDNKYGYSVGQENCDGTIIKTERLFPAQGDSKVVSTMSTGDYSIRNYVIYSPDTSTNVSEITPYHTKLFSAKPSGTSELTLSGGFSTMQSAKGVTVQSDSSLNIVGLQRLSVVPPNEPAANVGDLLTRVGANGEAEWRPAASICDQIQSLPSGTPAGGEKIIYFAEASVPTGYIGYDFDLTNMPSSCGGATDLFNFEVYDMRHCTQSTPPSPIACNNPVAINAFINSKLIPYYNANCGGTLSIGDLIYIFNQDGTATMWVAPSVAGYPFHDFVVGQIGSGVCEKIYPNIPTTHMLPTNGCFLGDAPTAAPAAWRLDGNAGTVAGTNFLGTTDAQDLVLKTNSSEIGRFSGDGLQSITLHGSSTNGGYKSLSWGDGNTITNTGHTSTCFGSGNTCDSDYSTVFGESNVANYGSTGSTTWGTFNVLNSSGSTVWGAFNTSHSIQETVFGQFSTDYIPVNTISFNPADRLLAIGNGTGHYTRNNALTMWKDGRSMWNGDVAKQNTWIGVNGTNPQNFINVTTPTGTLAAFSTEHTPSGNFAVFSSTASNSGITVNKNKQFAFTTTAGTQSTTLGATDTVFNYGATGTLFGGGAVATSTVEVNGSFATKALAIAANHTAGYTDNTLVCNNGATNITVTLPDPTICIGREYRVLRYAGSTGTITVTDTRGATASIQALAGTLGTTTTITALGAHDDWSVCFKAVTVGGTTSWLRID